MHGYPQFSFWISITLVKIYFSPTFSKPHKNTFELGGNVFKFTIHNFFYIQGFLKLF